MFDFIKIRNLLYILGVINSTLLFYYSGIAFIKQIKLLFFFKTKMDILSVCDTVVVHQDIQCVRLRKIDDLFLSRCSSTDRDVLLGRLVDDEVVCRQTSLVGSRRSSRVRSYKMAAVKSRRLTLIR